jgi:hypothetical protein
LKEQLHKLKNEIGEYHDFFSSEDIVLVTSTLKILKMMIETDASNETIQKYFIQLKYPIQIIEEKIKKFKKGVTDQASAATALKSQSEGKKQKPKILGDIKTPELIIQNGVILEGRCMISNDLKHSAKDLIELEYSKDSLSVEKIFGKQPNSKE